MEEVRRIKSFDDTLNCEWYMHSADDFVMCLGDINGHVGRHIDGLDGAHGRYGKCQRNFGRKNIIRVLPGKELCVRYMAQEREEEEGDIQNW